MSISKSINYLWCLLFWTVLLVFHWNCSSYFHRAEFLCLRDLYWISPKSMICRFAGLLCSNDIFIEILGQSNLWFITALIVALIIVYLLLKLTLSLHILLSARCWNYFGLLFLMFYLITDLMLILPLYKVKIMLDTIIFYKLINLLILV